MLSFRPLNASREDERPANVVPRELEIERLLGTVSKCLELQESGQMDEAESGLVSIIRTRVYKEPLQPVADIHGSPIHALQFITSKNFGTLLYAKGEVDEAIDYWKKALELDETDIFCLESLAKARLDQGNLEDAYQYYVSLSKYVPLEAHRTKVMEKMAMILIDLRFFEESASIAQRVLKQDPDRPICLKILQLTKPDATYLDSSMNKLEMHSYSYSLPSLLLDEQARPLIHKRNSNATDVSFANVRIIQVNGKLTWARLLSLVLEDLVTVVSKHEAGLGHLVAPIQIHMLEDDNMDTESDLPEAEAAEDEKSILKSAQPSPNKRKAAPTNDETDVFHRSSGRTRTKRATLTTTVDSEVKEIEFLSALDKYLPVPYTFDSDAWLSSSQTEVLKAAINKINSNPSKRTRAKKGEKYRVWNILAESEHWNEVLYSEEDISVNAFVQVWQNSDNKTILGLAGSLLVALVLGSRLNTDTTDSSSSAFHARWPAAVKHSIITLVKILECYSLGMLFRLPARFSMPTSKIIEFFLFLAELISDEIVVQGCRFDEAFDHLECFGEESKSTLTSTTRQSILDRLIAQIYQHLSQLTDEQRIRFEWLLTLPRLENDSDTAISALREFKSLFEETAVSNVSLKQCDATPMLSSPVIQSKITKIEAKLAIEKSKSDFDSENYEGVYDSLTSLFDGSEQEALKHLTSVDRYTLLNNYFTACIKLEKIPIALRSGMDLLHHVLDLFITEPDGDEWLHTAASVLESILHLCIGPDDSSCMDALIDQVQIPNTSVSTFSYDLMILIHLGWYYYQNLTEISRTLNKTVQDKRAKIIPIILVRAWILFLETLRTIHLPASKEIVSNPSSDSLAAILSWVHIQLGEVSICGADQGRYLKFLVAYISNLNGLGYEPEIYQAYGCLYGINIRYSPEIPIMEHNTVSQPFTRQAAEDIIMTVKDDTLEKLNTQGYRSLTSDVRDVAIKIETVFREPPMHDARFAYNHSVIDRWLSQRAQIMVPDPVSFRKLPATMEVTNMPSIYQYVYYFLGKIGWASYMLRQVYREESDLKNASSQLQYHVALNPHDTQGWYILGQTFALLADESLAINAAYSSRKKAIRDHQKKAYNAFLVASRLLARPSQRLGSCPSSFWSDFGTLCLQMALEPCCYGAFIERDDDLIQLWQSFQDLSKSNGELILNDSDLEPQNVVDKTDAKANDLNYQKKLLFPFAAYCFKKGLKIDSSNWLAHLQLAMTYRKLKQTPRVILDHFVLAIVNLPSDWISRESERVFDPLYMFFSFAVKSIIDHTLEPLLVSEAIAKISEKCGILSKASSYALAPDEIGIIEAMNESMDFKRALIQVCECLNKIRLLDKKHYHHKPIYRYAWLQYRIFNAPEKAKQEMCSLVSIKSSKPFKNIWKTEFERPGKHFFYFEKYVLFLLDLAWETKDSFVIRMILKKAHKADDLLPDPNRIQNLIMDRFIQDKHTAVTLEDRRGWDKAQLFTEKTLPKAEWKSSDALPCIKSSDPGWFLLACDLKRLAPKKSASLDEFIGYRFASLLMRSHTTGDSEKEDVQMEIVPNEPNPAQKTKSLDLSFMVQRALFSTKSL